MTVVDDTFDAARVMRWPVLNVFSINRAARYWKLWDRRQFRCRNFWATPQPDKAMFFMDLSDLSTKVLRDVPCAFGRYFDAATAGVKAKPMVWAGQCAITQASQAQLSAAMWTAIIEANRFTTGIPPEDQVFAEACFADRPRTELPRAQYGIPMSAGNLHVASP